MSGFSSEGLERLSDALKGYVDRGEIPGLVALVARGDDVHVDAFGVQDLSGGKPMVRDSLFRISSMTKPMTAAVAGLTVYDLGQGGDYAKPPAFASGGGGLVSTADDVLAFSRLMLAGGRHGAQQAWSPPPTMCWPSRA